MKEKLALFDSELTLCKASALPPLWYHDLELYECEQTVRVANDACFFTIHSQSIHNCPA